MLQVATYYLICIVHGYTGRGGGEEGVEEKGPEAAALPRHQEEEETDKTKQVHIKQTYEKH